MKNSKLIRDTPDALTAAVSYLGSLVTKGYEDLVSRVLVADGELWGTSEEVKGVGDMTGGHAPRSERPSWSNNS